MEASTPEQDARIVKSFEVCRSELKHEYGVLANRLNSYITSQAFLVSGYAISMGNMNKEWGDTFSLYFSLLLSVAALLLSVRAQPGISGACQVIQRWHVREADLFELNFGLDDYAVIREEDMRANNDRNLWFAQTSVWIFGISWSLMALLSLYLHIKKR